MSFLKDEKKEQSGAVVHQLKTGGKVDAYLGEGSKVVGSLMFEGAVELGGQIEGEVEAQGILTIGESAKIKAKLSGNDILVKGEVVGDIFASRTLALKKPARVYGNISSPNLSIEEGVIFEGKCSMGGADKKKDASSPSMTAPKVAGKVGA